MKAQSVARLRIENMVKLNDLSPIDKAHWELHLNVALKNNPSLKEQIGMYLKDDELPDIKHPSHIHDWLEQPDRRAEIEALNG